MMNPSSCAWSNPPPPGTEVEEEVFPKTTDFTETRVKEEPPSKAKTISDIDPFLKNPQYIEYEKRISSERRHKHRRSKSHERRHSRSRSRDRHKHKKDKKRRSRSRSKRSRSRGRRHRHRSRSHSRSRSRHRERKHKRSSSSDERSSRSSSRSHSYKSHRSRHSRRSRSRRSRSYSSHFSANDYDVKREPEVKIEEEEEEEEDEVEPPKENAFKNDGSFLEMFKKLQEQQAVKAEEAGSSEAKKPLPVFGKRRGGRVLKTGMVQKTRAMQDAELNDPQDAWSVYMKEVKKYKEACCDDDSKTRPLVK